ncbi:accessory Sec system protein Asp3 [Pediococcus pentosaceus]|uniref:accessory Sec system protein Asp3 n=2 Tax=Pediococcus pentosaceus TaxID=1255 RepID=UPI0018A1AFA6|nr:accessory Sec system protein Asp3 [Pediococcus pentosaceus]MBF7138572.1 accessory Sec system protein Asp3 [Pediococcus pentosaceus]
MNSSYVVMWPMATNGTYNYGSTISYEKGLVNFSNSQMSPGEAISSWKSKQDFDSNNAQFNQLPLLKEGEQYHIVVNAEVIPSDSVQVQINFLDTLGETIDGITTLSLDDYFEVPLGTQAYDLNLINLNNQGLTFKNIVITPRDTKFEIETFSSGTFRMVSIWDKEEDFFEEVPVYLRNRTLNTGSYIGQNQALRLYIEFDSRSLLTETELQSELQLAIHDLKDMVEERNLAFDAFAPDPVSLAKNDEKVMLVEKTASIELAKILHYYRGQSF